MKSQTEEIWKLIAGTIKQGLRHLLEDLLEDEVNTKVKALKLITTDGNPVLLKVAKEIYPLLKVQRCIVHKLRNAATKLKRGHLKPYMAEARGIFAASSKREAIRRFKTWKENWQVEAERAVRCMEEDLYHCLHYYAFPQGALGKDSHH